MVLLEACRAGVPVVATDVSGHPEVIVDGENGYLAPLDDVDALADRLCALVTDRERAFRMGARARQTFEARFRLETQVVQHLELYSSLVGG